MFDRVGILLDIINKMDSFLTLRDSGDDMGFFKQILESAQHKADLASYGDRRSEEIQRNDMDVTLEGKFCQIFAS